MPRGRVQTPWRLTTAAGLLLCCGCGGAGAPHGQSDAAAGRTDNARRPAGQAETGDPAAAVTAAAAVESVVTAFREHRPAAVWDALPPGYQQDVNGLIRDFGRQMDPELWDRLRSLAGKLAALLRERRDLILDYPPLRDDPLFATGPLQQVAANWHVAVGLLDALAAADLDRLKNFDGRATFMALDRDELARVRQLAVLLSEDNPFWLLDEL
ncbi:MAG TPA: hypothetical protein VML55_18330, partial [Planctomycetaceae bacterium]|nr:hypothetical protein [Planctomycetaceae bacterium]